MEWPRRHDRRRQRIDHGSSRSLPLARLRVRQCGQPSFCEQRELRSVQGDQRSFRPAGRRLAASAARSTTPPYVRNRAAGAQGPPRPESRGCNCRRGFGRCRTTSGNWSAVTLLHRALVGPKRCRSAMKNIANADRPKSVGAMLPPRPFRGSGKVAQTACNSDRREGKSCIPTLNQTFADSRILKISKFPTFRIAGRPGSIAAA